MFITEKKPEERRKKWIIGAVCLVVAASGLSLAHQMTAGHKNEVTSGQPPGGGGPGRPQMQGGTQGMGRPQMPGTRGQILTISAGAITIQPREGGPKTFTLSADSKITVDQQPADVTGLKAGQRARVVSTDDKSATEVHVRTRPFGGRGGYPGGAPAAARP